MFRRLYEENWRFRSYPAINNTVRYAVYSSVKFKDYNLFSDVHETIIFVVLTC